MVKQKEYKWKPIELDGSVFTGDCEGLVGIEELTEYDLGQFKGRDRIIAVSSPEHKKTKKRKKKHKDGENKKTKLPKITNKNEKKSFETEEEAKSKTNIKKETEKSCTKKKKFSATMANKNREQLHIEEESEISDDKCVTVKVDENESDMIPWNLIGVPKLVTKTLLEQGFKEPTEIQRLAIPPAIMGRRDILGAAETGSGKTLAFGIPIIHGILKNLEKEEKVNENPAEQPDGSMLESDLEGTENEGIGCVRVVNLKSDVRKVQGRNRLWALVLTPTRELAIQIKNHLNAALKYMDLKVAVVVGGMSVEKQQRMLKGQPHIVVATPGRLWEMISKGEPHLSNIEDIRFLAIDETDRMTEVNHFPELHSLLERINVDPSKRKLRQNFVFSATLTLVHELPKYLTQNKKGKKNKKNPQKLTVEGKLKSLIDLLGITDPKIIDVTKKTGMTQLLTESAIMCSLEDKDYYLYYFLLKHSGRTLVFCNSISCVRRLASLLNILNCHPLPLHANMLQKQRLKNLDRFRDRPTGLLLATDVAARGLDIPKVEHVIHYQVPRTSESYVHRSGRTARANHEGLTLLLVEPSEGHLYSKLLKTLKRDKELPAFPVTELLMKSVKQRVNLARDIDQLKLSHKRTNANVGWLEKAAKEMDLLLDDDEIPEKMDNETSLALHRQITAKEKQLSALLSTTMTPLGFSYKYPTLNQSVKTVASTFHTSSAIQAVKDANKVKAKKESIDGTKKFRLRKKKKKKVNTN